MQRELPFSPKYNGVIDRKEPTSHEFRARKSVLVLSTTIILYALAGGNLQSGTYGLVKICNASIIESLVYLAFLWTIYRFRVVCFDRFQDFHKKAINIAEQNIDPYTRNSWLNVYDRFIVSISEINEDKIKYIEKDLGEIPDWNEKPKDLRFSIELHTYSRALAIDDLRNGSTIWVHAKKFRFGDAEKEKTQLSHFSITKIETRAVLFRAYKLVARWDDSLSEWLAPWVWIVFALFCLYYRIITTLWSLA